jgi:hypothetical protein
MAAADRDRLAERSVVERKALAISRAVGARVLEGWTLMAMGRAAWVIDVDARPAAAWFEDALRIFREIDEPYGISWMLGCLAEEQCMAGDLEGAVSRATEGFDVGTRSGLVQLIAVSRRVLAPWRQNGGSTPTPSDYWRKPPPHTSRWAIAGTLH